MTWEEVLALKGADTEQLRAACEALAQAGRQCREERARFFALFDDAPVFMSIIEGPEQRVVMVNRRVREELPGFVGRTLIEMYPKDNPVLAAIERVYATGVPESVRALPIGG